MNFLNDIFIKNSNLWHLSILDFVLIIGFFKIRESFLKSMAGVFVFYFLGTFLHEMCHYIIALILRAKPRMPFLLPKKMNDGSISLGRVEIFSPSWWKNPLIALAPLFMLFIVWVVHNVYFAFFHFSFISCIIYVYLLIMLIDSAIPSREDLRIAISNPLGILLWVLVGVLIYNCFSYLSILLKGLPHLLNLF